jgi:hypothetical protein
VAILVVGAILLFFLKRKNSRASGAGFAPIGNGYQDERKIESQGASMPEYQHQLFEMRGEGRTRRVVGEGQGELP